MAKEAESGGPTDDELIEVISSPTKLSTSLMDDHDVPMSELSEISYALEHPPLADKAKDTGHSYKEPAVKRYISLPEAIEDDIRINFNMAPQSLMQRPRHSRVPTRQNINFSREKQSGIKNDDQLRPEKESPDKPTISNSDSSQSVRLGQDFLSTLVIPLNHVQHAPKITGLEEREGLEAQNRNNESAVHSIKPLHDFKPCNEQDDQDGVDRRESQGTTLQSRNSEHAVQRSCTNPETRDKATSDVTQLTNEAGGSTSIKDVLTSERSKAPLTQQEHVDSILRMQPTDKFRVTKTSSTVQRSGSITVPGQTCDAAQTATLIQPSEEDLLYLLMHHARKRDLLDSSSRQRQDQLERQNNDLNEDKLTLQEELDRITVDRDQHSEDAKQAWKQLENFELKYTKLKTWALEMNKEYAVVRQEGADLKASLTRLRCDYSDLREPLQIVLASNRQAHLDVIDIKKDVGNCHQSLGTLEGQLQDTRETLAEKRAELRTLKSVNQKQESAVGHILENQRRLAQQTRSQQEQLLRSVKDMIADAASGLDRRLQVDGIGEVLRLVKDVVAAGVSTKSDLELVKAKTEDVLDHLESFQQGIERSVKICHNAGNFSSLTEDIVLIKKAIETLKPNLDNMQEVCKANAQLQEKTLGDASIHSLLEKAKHAAENRCLEVQRNNDKLIDSLTTISEQDARQRSLMTSSSQAQLDKFVLKHDDAQKELRDVETKLKIAKKEAASLRGCLDDYQTQHEAEKEQLQQRYDSETRELNARLDSARASLTLEHQANLRTKDKTISELKETISATAGDLNSVREEARTSRAHNEELGRRLQREQGEALAITQQLEEQRSLNLSLIQKMSTLQQIADSVPDLEQNIATKEEINSKLRCDVDCLQQLRESLEAVSAERKSQENVISQLNTDLKMTKEQTQRTMDLQNKRLERQVEQLTKLQAKATSVDQLEISVSIKDADINKLRSLLEDAQKQCQQLTAMRVEKQELVKQVEDLQQETSTLKEQAAQVSALELSLEASNQICAAKTIELEDQLSRVTELEKELAASKAQHQKAEALASRNLDTTAPKVHCLQEDQYHVQIINGDLDTVFTQNTNLSNIDASGQVKDSISEVPETLDDSGSMHINLPQVIDPKIVMRATPASKTRQSTSYIKPLSQTSIIPDSQLDPCAEFYDNQHHRPALSNNCLPTSSPLSDVNEDCFDTDIEVDESQPNYGIDTKSQHDSHQEISVFDIPTTSPKRLSRSKAQRTLLRRPSSVVSQEDMLLLASDTGRHDSPRTLNQRHSRPARTVSTSENADRQQSANNHRNNLPVDSANAMAPISNSHIARATSREPNRPNSAAKRSADDMASSPCRPLGGKRLRLSSTRTEHRASGPTDSIAKSEHAGAMEGSSQGGKRGGKKSKGGRKQPKQDKYSARFNESSQC